MQELVTLAIHKDFESIKKVDKNGFEYWEARELMPLLGYARWEKFYEALRRAMATCVSTDQVIQNHFRGAGKMVGIGSKTQRKVKDYHCSRFACYLIAQNGDPRKPEIAFAQTYFAVQTRKQEIFETMDAEGKRITSRHEVRTWNKILFDSAKLSGVDDFGKFNNAGYIGLYGMPAEDIKRKKKIGNDDILDRAGSLELAANLFRITQTEDKLRKEQVFGEAKASGVHHEVGKAVRKTIKELGGTMPEDLEPEVHIHEVIRKKIGVLPKKKKLLKKK
jgi:DNA-damage-inducible protein D